MFLDITATHEKRKVMLEVVKKPQKTVLYQLLLVEELVI